MGAEPLVIGVDSSTQSTKAIAWNARGEAVAEGRGDIPLSNPALDHWEQDPADWWRSTVEALKSCTAAIDTTRLQGLAISNQRETNAFVDKAGESIHPGIIWLDERARAQVRECAERLGADNIHRITGRPPDITPSVYRLLWMKQQRPDIYERTDFFVDVQSYLVRRLCGGDDYRTGWISADPLGMYDMVKYRWAPEFLEILELDESRLPKAFAPGTRLGEITAEAAAATGLPVGLPVFAAGGDGQCAGLGVNCTIPDRAYINLGTAVVSGIWSPEYRYDRAWRTELAAQGEGYIYETCLRSGAFLINWFVDRFVAKGKADAAVFQRLEAAADQLPIGSDGLLMQPYFSGVMDPYWDTSARGVFVGLSASHGEAHLYRTIIESMTLDQVMRTQSQEAAANQTISHYVAIGGGANSPLWRQMLADASNKDVHVSQTVEASALGAGMIAATGAGWFTSITEAAGAMAGDTTPVVPDGSRYARYQELLDIYRSLYQATATINQQLVDFAAGPRT